MAATTTRSKNLVRASRYSRIRSAAGSWPAATSAARAASASASPYGAGTLVNPRRYAATRRAVAEGPPSSMSAQPRPSRCHHLILPWRRSGPPVTGSLACGSVDHMTTDSAHRGIRIERTGPSTFVAVNERGGRLTMSQANGLDFTPVELLLAAIGGGTCFGGAPGGLP